jgi:hypothetical protein
VLLFARAIYVVISAGWKLWTGQGGEFSLLGLIVSVAAIPLMYFLSRRKVRLANALGSRALRADPVESITCGWLAFVVVGGIGRAIPDRCLVARSVGFARSDEFPDPRRSRGLGRRGLLRRWHIS